MVNPRTGRERTLPRAVGRPAPRRARDRRRARGRRRRARGGGDRRRGHAARAGRRDRRPAPARRPRAGAPRALAPLAGDRGARLERAGVDCGSTRARPRRTPTRPRRRCSPPARGRTCRRGPSRRRRRAVRGGRRLDGDREPGGRRGPGARRGLGRRLGRPRRGRDARRAGRWRSRSPAPRPTPGWTLQQYQRNLYLARFDERGIPILHHTEVLGDRLRHLFSGREHRLPDVATLVFAHGRVPEDGLWAELEGRPGMRTRGRRPRPAHGRGGDARGNDQRPGGLAAGSRAPPRCGSPRPRRRARGGGRRPPPRCGSGRRAWRGSARRGRWRSSRPCRAACRSRGSSRPRRRARAPGARAG